MATVVNAAFPSDDTTSGGDITIRQSVADPHIETQDTDGSTADPSTALDAITEDDRQPEITYETA